AMSGDIKFEKTWLFNPAVNKFPRLETLVLESTYGGYHDIQPSRHEAAQQLKEILRRVLTRGGKVLVPVFAVGRSQEVMPILEYFKGWADNPLHALVFVGFQSEGSLGRRIQREAREITLMDRGQPLTLPIKMDVETVDGFSGHSDRLQLLNYVGTMEPRPERVIVNHGEEFKCSDLASGLYKKFGLETRAPMNLETIRLK